MDLLQLTYFCAAAESESFTRTAEKFFVPTSSISQVIRRLETELGTCLFDRHGNRVSLNRAGRLLYERARRALDELTAAKHMLADHAEQPCGEVRLLIDCNRAAVARAIEACKQRYADISFSLCHRYTEDMTAYDLLITDAPIGGEAYERELLVKERLLLAVAKGRPEAAARSLGELREARFVTMQEGSSLRRCTTRLCAEAGFTPRIAIECDDPLYIRKYLELGLGVALVPTFSWAGLLSEQVVTVDVGEHYRSTYVLYRRAGYLSRACRAFLSCLREAFPCRE